MGNTNEKSVGENYRSENNKEEEKGFFDSFVCCGKLQSKEINQKIDILIPDFIWFYESDSTEKNLETDKLIWIPYPIELNQIIEKSFISNKQGLQINFSENKEETFMINFSEMMQFRLTTSINYTKIDINFSQKNTSLYKRIKRLNKNEIKTYSNIHIKDIQIQNKKQNFIQIKTSFDNSSFLEKINFIKDYNSTHNIQKPIQILSLFKVLAFPLRCLDIFSSTIYLMPEWIQILKKNFKNCRINSFPHLKQLLTEEINLESYKLSGKNNNLNSEENGNFDVNGNSIINEEKFPFDNYLMQANIYNDIIENHMDQDNFEMIIIYLFSLEGFIQERINFILISNSIGFSNLKLFFLLLQSAIRKDNINHTSGSEFIKVNNLVKEDPQTNKKMLKLYKSANLSSDVIKNYLNLFTNNQNQIKMEEKSKKI
jgi:hypothetical protein